MSDTQFLMAAGTGTQPQRIVLTTAADADAAQASGEWIASDAVVEVRR